MRKCVAAALVPRVRPHFGNMKPLMNQPSARWWPPCRPSPGTPHDLEVGQILAVDPLRPHHALLAAPENVFNVRPSSDSLSGILPWRTNS